MKQTLYALALAPLTGIAGAKVYVGLHPIPSIEEMDRNYYEKKARLYEHSSGSNLEGKLQDQIFGIILVDMQDSFLQGIHTPERIQLIREQKKVLAVAAEYDLPVLIFEMDNYGQTTKELQELVDTVPRTKTFSKNRNDGFEIYDPLPRFDPETFPSDWLKQQGVDSVYMMGVNGNACVKETADSAMKMGFTIATSTDVIATANKNAATGSCAYESCIEARASLSDFVEKGILHNENDAFLDYFRGKKVIINNTKAFKADI